MEQLSTIQTSINTTMVDNQPLMVNQSSDIMRKENMTIKLLIFSLYVH